MFLFGRNVRNLRNVKLDEMEFTINWDFFLSHLRRRKRKRVWTASQDFQSMSHFYIFHCIVNGCNSEIGPNLSRTKTQKYICVYLTAVTETKRNIIVWKVV